MVSGRDLIEKSILFHLWVITQKFTSDRITLENVYLKSCWHAGRNIGIVSLFQSLFVLFYSFHEVINQTIAYVENYMAANTYPEWSHIHDVWHSRLCVYGVNWNFFVLICYCHWCTIWNICLLYSDSILPPLPVSLSPAWNIVCTMRHIQSTMYGLVCLAEIQRLTCCKAQKKKHLLP